MESKLKTVFLAPIFVLSTRLPATDTAAKFKKCKHWFSRGNLRIRFSRYMAFFRQTRELLLIEHSEKGDIGRGTSSFTEGQYIQKS